MRKVIGRFVPTGEPGYRQPFNVLTMKPSEYLAPAWEGKKENGEGYHVTEKAWRFEPVWDGKGLPPVGCKFEYGTHRSPAKCIAIGNDYVFAQRGEYGSDDYEEWLIDKTTTFYPTSDKREDFIRACNSDDTVLGTSRLFRPTAGALYEAIAAGKIPGVKLSD